MFLVCKPTDKQVENIILCINDLDRSHHFVSSMVNTTLSGKNPPLGRMLTDIYEQEANRSYRYHTQCTDLLRSRIYTFKNMVTTKTSYLLTWNPTTRTLKVNNCHMKWKVFKIFLSRATMLQSVRLLFKHP